MWRRENFPCAVLVNLFLNLFMFTLLIFFLLLFSPPKQNTVYAKTAREDLASATDVQIVKVRDGLLNTKPRGTRENRVSVEWESAGRGQVYSAIYTSDQSLFQNKSLHRIKSQAEGLMG